MKSRCKNHKHKSYSCYGGRGISVCDRWLQFDNFAEDMLPTYVPGMTLDRIDVDGDYHHGNCKWSTPKEQANNRRSNVLVNTPLGVMTLAMASDAMSVSRTTLRDSLNSDNKLRATSLGISYADQEK